MPCGTCGGAKNAQVAGRHYGYDVTMPDAVVKRYMSEIEAEAAARQAYSAVGATAPPGAVKRLDKADVAG